MSALTAAQARDLQLLARAIEAKPVRTGLALAKLGLVRVVTIDGRRAYSLTTRGIATARALP